MPPFVNPPRKPNVEGVVAALLSAVAAVSMAQTPAAPKTTIAASAPADATTKPMHHKKHHATHHAKKADAAAPAASAAK